MNTLFALLIAYKIKHFLADYPLQTPYMLGKFLPGRKWIKPLAAHASVHACFTFAISVVTLEPRNVLWLCLGLTAFDFIVHFTMDRIKASPHMLGRFKALSAREYPNASDKEKDSNKYFWWSLGFDQLIHGLTDLAIVAGIWSAL